MTGRASNVVGGLRRIRSWARQLQEKQHEATLDFRSPSSTFASLISDSDALAALRHGGVARRVAVVLPRFAPDAVYAGLRTAFSVTALIAERTNRRPTFVVTELTPGKVSRAADAISTATGLARDAFDVMSVAQARSETWREDDIWIATHWTTAARLWSGAAANAINASRVIYLVQDYEPDFAAASTDRAVADATYHAGFRLLVNSSPVAARLRQTGVDIDDRVVFAPHLDLGALEAASRARRPAASPRVLMYGRPSKPRNMFGLATAALREASRRLGPSSAQHTYVSAGEKHRDVAMPFGQSIRALGNVGWQGHYDELARADVVLSLQASAHPSHPPLEAAIAGSFVVTNDVNSTRAGIHPRISAVRADPYELADALIQALDAAAQDRDRGFLPAASGALGKTLPDCIESVVEDLD